MTDRIPWPADKAPLPITERCPICGAGLLLDAGESCEQIESGEWIASEIRLDCETEPDIDSSEWPAWHRAHYGTPYIDWLPLEMRVLEDVRRRFCFDP